MARRPEDTQRFRKLMQKSVQEGRYEDEFRIDHKGRRDAQDVHIVVDIPGQETELVPVRRSSPDHRFSTEAVPVYLALAGLLTVGAVLAWHGVAVGGATYLLHVFNQYGFTQEALHALSLSQAAQEVLGGVGLGVGSFLGAGITTNLSNEQN